MELTKDEEITINEYLVSKGLPTNVSVTFDDVFIPEDESPVRSRAEIYDFSTNLAEDFVLKMPLVSANMESVTGVSMAVAMAREGGLWFLPQSLKIKHRLEMLDQIRRTDCAFIHNPLTVRPDATLHEAKKRMEKFGVNSLIITKKDGFVAGILTSRDWHFEADDSKTVISLAGATNELVVAPKDIIFGAAAAILKENKIEKLPLVNAGGQLAGLITAHGLFYNLYHPRATRDDKGRFVLCGTVGVGKTFTKSHLKEAEAQAKKGIRILLIDTARAFSVNTKEAVIKIRKNFPELILVVGNVSSAKGARALFEWGADVVKVNQGRGHVCRTSKIGVGQPQLTAIAECSVIARRYGKRIMADGG